MIIQQGPKRLPRGTDSGGAGLVRKHCDHGQLISAVAGIREGHARFADEIV
jgi:hypothetical protein